MAQHSDGTTAADLARLVPAGGIVVARTPPRRDPPPRGGPGRG